MTPAERAAAWERLIYDLAACEAHSVLARVKCLRMGEPGDDARASAHHARLALDAYEALRADDETPVLPRDAKTRDAQDLIEYRRAEAATLRQERDEAAAAASNLATAAAERAEIAVQLRRERDEARALLRECRPWVSRGLMDDPAPTTDDWAVLARLDALLGGRDAQ